MVIGAHAVAVYASPRATGDLDISVRPTASNAERVWRALVEFGGPLDQLTRQDLVADELVFEIGHVVIVATSAPRVRHIGRMSRRLT